MPRAGAVTGSDPTLWVSRSIKMSAAGCWPRSIPREDLKAVPIAPLPDLLSTATALHALSRHGPPPSAARSTRWMPRSSSTRSLVRRGRFPRPLGRRLPRPRIHLLRPPRPRPPQPVASRPVSRFCAFSPVPHLCVREPGSVLPICRSDQRRVVALLQFQQVFLDHLDLFGQLEERFEQIGLGRRVRQFSDERGESPWMCLRQSGSPSPESPKWPRFCSISS